MAVSDFVNLYNRILRAAGLRVRVYISAKSRHNCDISDHITQDIGERTTEYSPHLFNTLASDDRL